MRARLLLPLLAVALVAGAAAGPAVAAGKVKPQQRQAYAPAATATVHPGVQTNSPSGQCTANFVYTDGSATYLGQAAHCTGTGEATDTDGCDAGTLPEGTAVRIDGASRPGVLAYSSWVRMQQAGETDPNACAFNDFALIRIDPADVARTNPSVPVFGGPVGLRSGSLSVGEKVASYGNSSLRFGLSPLSPKYGRSLGTSGAGWNHTVYTATPGIPGDSGSGFLDGSGRAFGTLSTVAILPLAASNGVGDLARELAYAQTHGMPGLRLENGTEPFTGAL